jgi:pectin methylesterase-like acyl-CoA thioesterase
MSEILKIKGTVYKVSQEEVKSEKFKKREVILEVVKGEYKEYLSIQFSNAKCDLLNNVRQGDMISISINLRGRLWTGADGVEKCFNTFEGWQVETDNLGGTTTNIPIQKKMGNIETAFQEEAIRMMAEDDDDLPF